MRLILPKHTVLPCRHEFLHWTKLQSFQGQCALCPWVANILQNPVFKVATLQAGRHTFTSKRHVRLISLRSRIHFAASPTSSSPSCSQCQVRLPVDMHIGTHPKGAKKLMKSTELQQLCSCKDRNMHLSVAVPIRSLSCQFTNITTSTEDMPQIFTRTKPNQMILVTRN